MKRDEFEKCMTERGVSSGRLNINRIAVEKI
jgi:hypothetical protein